ncbi:hypothetical protein FSPOR_11187 [Fusarium sporotrichioides]|uniref:BTB domain-containing protein n=1 Tax=Fusarium sporotrichioides TaxID=5514 RepID=A0A395RHP3_FUSSP|nr:hypothetical protein FSPOR_11187 [Fusarium sporotrichioides]
MNLKLLEKMRASYPSRASLMDFINHTDGNTTTVKPDTRKADEMPPTNAETNLAKTPLGDITNTQTSRDNSVQHGAIKEKPAIFRDEIAEPESIEAPTGEQAGCYPSPSTDGEVSCMVEEPASPPYRHEFTGTHFSKLPISEDTNDEMTSVTSERVELNPEAPVFTQQRALEKQSIGSPAFEVTSQDLSYFDHERTDGTKEESPNHQEAVGPYPIYYLMYEADDNKTSPLCDKQASPVTEGYPPNHHEAAEHKSANASASDDKTEELSPISGKTNGLTHHEATGQQSVKILYYEYLDTILEESESEHDEVIKTKFKQGNNNSDTSSRFENSIASSSELVTNESVAIDSQMSESLELGDTIVDPDTPITVASEHLSDGGKKRIIRFDRDGDLYLKVGTNHSRNMLVDSRALGRASAKLYAVISESAKDDSGDHWTIIFPEDDPKSFAILLNLIHARFEKVPANVTLDRLFGVCTLANKYGMTSVLRPVAERWYLSARTLDIASIFKMAFIAWELGFATDFGEIVGYITHNCSQDEDFELVFGPSKERLAENEVMRKLPIMMSGKLCGSRHGRSEICLMLGKMFSKAEEEGVVDLFAPGSLFQHCESLSMSLATLERNISSVAEYMDVCSSCVGVFELLTEVRAQFGRAGDPLYLHHIRAMATQAKKVQMGTWVYDDEKYED